MNPDNVGRVAGHPDNASAPSILATPARNIRDFYGIHDTDLLAVDRQSASIAVTIDELAVKPQGASVRNDHLTTPV
jgi:hypothetical protein